METIKTTLDSQKKTNVMYVHDMTHRTGHVIGELHYLLNTYPSEIYNIEIVALSPRIRKLVNAELFEIATRDLTVTFTEDADLFKKLAGYKEDPVIVKDGTVYNLNYNDIFVPFNDYYAKHKSFRFYFKLNDHDLSRGNKIKQSLDIPLDAPIVTLHVREQGFLPHLKYHSFRDSDIETYIPAIEHLISQGYYIVRIGDKSMKKLPIASKQVIDAPFHEKYEEFFDPYFVATSKFFFGTTSGPISIAQAFGIPTLCVNGQIHPNSCCFQNSIFVPKKIFSRPLERHLTYEEISLSPIMNFSRTEEYQENQLEIEHNSPEEIYLSTVEFIERLNDNYSDLQLGEIFHKQIQEIGEKSHNFMKQRYNIPNITYTSDTMFSTEFLKKNPYFLGHPWAK